MIQIPICTTTVQMACVANISVEKQECLKKCSGLLVTSYDSNQKYKSERLISKLSKEYWKYKGYFKFQNFEFRFRSK